MKKFILVLLISFHVPQLFAIDVSAALFTYDEAKIDKEFKELHQFDSVVRSNPDFLNSENGSTSIVLNDISENCLYECNTPFKIMSPGKIPSFWFTFGFSAIGTYTLYGAVAGPISVGVVYFSSGKDKSEVKKALWGCAAGTGMGAGLYILSHL